MKPFLLIATRAEDAAADNEYAAFLKYLDLPESGLVRHRLEREELGQVTLGGYSGILLGGSPFNSTDPPERKTIVQKRAEAELRGLLNQVVAADFPLLGACYGISAVGCHQGATLNLKYGEPVGAVTISLTAEGVMDPLLAGMPKQFEAFVGHKEAISSLPDSCALLATSPSCPVQMFRVKQNVYATQFHPELDVDGLCTRVDVYKDAGYFPPEKAEQVKERARQSAVTMPSLLLRNFVDRYAIKAGPTRYAV